MSYPIVSSNPQVQSFYEQLRRSGESHLLADMFAHRQPPMSNSDREFLEGYANGNQFEGQDYQGNWYKKQAKRAGVDTTGKVYLSSLARYPGDPQAWVSGRGDVKDRIEKREGWSVTGSVNAQGPPRDTENAQVGVDPALVEEHAQNAILSDLSGDLSRKPFEEVKEAVKDKIKPHWVK